MAGHSIDEAISVSEDENDAETWLQDEVDIQQYDNDSDEVDDDFAIVDPPPTLFEPCPTEFELPSLSLVGKLVQRGTIVELEDRTGRTSGRLLSGDFLLVRKIVENTATEEVVLRGYLMRRVECIAPLFDRKLNDLFMLIEVHEDDPRPPFVQGLHSVRPEEVVGIRRCVFTNLSYELQGQSHVNHTVAHRNTRAETRAWIFHNGTLICRWVHVIELFRGTKGRTSYGGEARRMYKREVADFSEATDPTHKNKSEAKRVASAQRTHHVPSKTPQHLPQKTRVFTLGDVFCGIGGVSEAARQAGYHVLWGLEKDPKAMSAYRENFPGAIHLEMDAHDFPGIVKRSQHGCDHVHLSFPCCFWSQSHTTAGKNDQANLEALFTVAPTLAGIKSKTFSLEQAPGLIKIQKHRLYWRILLNSILNEGYSVRYKVQEQAWFGVGQHRARLVVVGAKIGIPIPPLPAPRYGPPGAGLRRYVTIADSLRFLEQCAHSLRGDPYHQPNSEIRTRNGEVLDPNRNLARCVTTSGGENLHYLGTRPYTARELSQFQGMPLTFHFSGRPNEAKKQVGNVWPVKPCRVYFELWAAHMEAFYAGMIDPEDEVLDLYSYLEDKGITIPKPAAIDIDKFNTPSRRSRNPQPEFRYLPQIEKTVKPRVPLQLWGKRKEIDAPPQRTRRNDANAVHESLQSVCSQAVWRGDIPLC
ncbi:S-adenosyl-L-methionine-dependent methyltransferase [Decorospora gaudefroyi]|uniref:DNA (cytosine-5-)-methyltransferase n=1 Tax=Decorospora gaudefroyi TaxID=184978 RepID=A0A6A5KF08_9PLEO|nr:S-adenosyl-L-methionine-dependent methyltransferase [Decorospora gaudefroyi]